LIGELEIVAKQQKSERLPAFHNHLLASPIIFSSCSSYQGSFILHRHERMTLYNVSLLSFSAHQPIKFFLERYTEACMEAKHEVRCSVFHDNTKYNPHHTFCLDPGWSERSDWSSLESFKCVFHVQLNLCSGVISNEQFSIYKRPHNIQ